MAAVLWSNHGYEPQSKLRKHIQQQAEGYYTLLMQDNSTNKLLFASLPKFESHYPPRRGVVQLTSLIADDLQVMHFVIVPLSFARGIIRLTLQTSSRLVGIRFQRVSLKWSFTNNA